MPTVRHARGTQADFNTLVAADGLIEGQLYHITDLPAIAIATGVDTYNLFTQPGSGGGDQLVYFAYNGANSSTFTTTATTCPYDTELKTTAGISLSGGEITLDGDVIGAGDYLVEADSAIEMSSSNSRSSSQMFIEVATDAGGFSEPGGTRLEGYNREINEGTGGGSTGTIVTLTAGQTKTIRVRGVRHSGGGSAFRFTADQQRIKITKLAS